MERLDVRTAARGRWRGILHSLGMDERSLSGKHCPCPLCGGKDRFRFDDKDGRGTYYCSGCGAGDGVKLAMGLTACHRPAHRSHLMIGTMEPGRDRHIGATP